jgi:Na+-translocating ferredoxin:NAD+ oxidoreductase RnfC subunit
MRIGLLPEVYPAGDEVITIYEVTGRVVPAGKIPIEVGVTVFNVETMLNAYFALQGGKPVVDKYITVTGAVRNPVTLKVPLGITASKLITLAGGATVEDYALINGGPMTGMLMNPSDVVTKTTNAILVLPQDHLIVQKRQCNSAVEMKRAMASCCQCRMCTDLCPRFLLGHPIEPHSFMRSASSGVTGDVTPYIDTYFCCSCGLCEMYSCFQGLSPRTLMAKCKSGLRKNGVPMPEVIEKPVNSQRNGRYVPMSRLIARLNLTEYNKPAPLLDEEVTANRVKLMLSQHIGAPAVPVVKTGDLVQKGQIIAACDATKLGTNIHASIAGKVLGITDRYILIGD